MKRLGRNGAEEIIEHPWFKGIDTEKLLQKKIPAPWLPPKADDGDTRNFDEKFKKMDVKESIIDGEKAKKIMQHKEIFDQF